ncbi:MAG: hypothetical protein ABSA47_19115, partial [Verrucomicrobiota bacterium]
MKTDSGQSKWANSPVANLVRYVPSGVYFARARISGKLIRRSLKTDVLSVAQLRLSDLLKTERQAEESRASVSKGRMTFGDALAIYSSRLEAKVELKPNAKLYRQKCIEGLVKSWPGLRETDVRKISERECLNWAARFGAKYSPSVYNNTVGTLRHVLDIAIAEGARYGNPATIIKKAKI